jgi:hypothetical protein
MNGANPLNIEKTAKTLMKFASWTGGPKEKGPHCCGPRPGEISPGAFVMAGRSHFQRPGQGEDIRFSLRGPA